MAIENTFDDKSKATISVDGVISVSLNFKFDFMIITFSNVLIDELLERNEIKETDSPFHSVNGEIKTYYLTKHPNIGIYMTMVGAPMTVGLIEESMVAFKCHSFIMFGTCGSLNKELTTGNYVIPTEAYRDEGTSYHYMKNSDFVKIKNSQELSDFFKKENIQFIEGKTWTTDSFYRETINNVKKRKDAGCIVVEMEVSALEAASRFYGLNYYPFLISGDIVEENWDKTLLSSLNHSNDILYASFVIATKFILSKLQK